MHQGTLYCIIIKVPNFKESEKITKLLRQYGKLILCQETGQEDNLHYQGQIETIVNIDTIRKRIRENITLNPKGSKTLQLPRCKDALGNLCYILKEQDPPIYNNLYDEMTVNAQAIKSHQINRDKSKRKGDRFSIRDEYIPIEYVPNPDYNPLDCPQIEYPDNREEIHGHIVKYLHHTFNNKYMLFDRCIQRKYTNLIQNFHYPKLALRLMLNNDPYATHGRTNTILPKKKNIFLK